MTQNNLIGFNVKWDASEKQSYVRRRSTVSKLNPTGQLSSIDVDVGYGPSGPNGTCNGPQVTCNGTSVGISGVGSNNLPYPTGIGPNGNAALFINNGLIGSHVLPMSSPARTRTRSTSSSCRALGRRTTQVQVRSAIRDNKENLSEFDNFAEQRLADVCRLWTGLQ